VSTIEINGGVELPANRYEISLHTADGLTLVGELAIPVARPPIATLVMLHPLPTAGGFMDSHILRKAAARLPDLADLAVVRFNTRGTVSPRGRSEGTFGDGVAERYDLEAAMSFVQEQKLPHVWLVGWSFGTEIALRYGGGLAIDGAILLSPPLHRATDDDVAGWADNGKRLVAVIPEFDDYLKPAEAMVRFSSVPGVELVAVAGAKHLWVGEAATRRVLTEIVARANPSALPLPTRWTEETAPRFSVGASTGRFDAEERPDE